MGAQHAQRREFGRARAVYGLYVLYDRLGGRGRISLRAVARTVVRTPSETRPINVINVTDRETTQSPLGKTLFHSRTNICGLVEARFCSRLS
jgi:hypothetical protein